MSAALKQLEPRAIQVLQAWAEEESADQSERGRVREGGRKRREMEGERLSGGDEGGGKREGYEGVWRGMERERGSEQEGASGGAVLLYLALGRDT
eukprot:2768772-Rhodomonas_salina.1